MKNSNKMKIKRLPRKLKKKCKKDGVYVLMCNSIPVVRQVLEYKSRKSLTELLTTSFNSKDTDGNTWKFKRHEMLDEPKEAVITQDILNVYGANDKNKNQQ